MKRLLLIAALLACTKTKDAAPTDSAVAPDTLSSTVPQALTVMTKIEPDTLIATEGYSCYVQNHIHWLETQVGDVKSSSFCKWKLNK